MAIELAGIGCTNATRPSSVRREKGSRNFTEAANHLAIGFTEVGIKFFEGVIDGAIEDGLAAMREERARRRDCHFRHRAGWRDRFEVTEVLDHRMARERAELCRRTVRERFRLAALKTFDVRR